MTIHYLPDDLLAPSAPSDLTIYTYQVDSQTDKSKVNLNRNVFSFLTNGQKEVHFADTTVCVTEQQALLIGAGNCLMTERVASNAIYQSNLFFFSQKPLSDFLVKYSGGLPT